MAEDMDGTDMAFMKKFGSRAASTLAGRRERETRPLAQSDRRSISTVSTKSRQLNLKVTPEFYERVAAMARNRRLSMPEYVAWAVEMAETHSG